MDEIFTSTHWAGCTRNMLVNNERILHVERFEGERVSYTVTFDNGKTLELDQQTGEMFIRQLEELRRPRPAVQYVRREEDRRTPPVPRRRRATNQAEAD